MSVNKVVLLSLFCTLIFSASAQKLVIADTLIFGDFSEKTSEGNLKIFQDTIITSYLLANIENDSKITGIKNGYRIQIFSTSGQNARENTKKTKKQFIELFPDYNTSNIYISYQPPFFKLRVGNYRNKFEAITFYKHCARQFPNAYIVKTSIKYPDL